MWMDMRLGVGLYTLQVFSGLFVIVIISLQSFWVAACPRYLFLFFLNMVYVRLALFHQLRNVRCSLSERLMRPLVIWALSLFSPFNRWLALFWTPSILWISSLLATFRRADLGWNRCQRSKTLFKYFLNFFLGQSALPIFQLTFRTAAFSLMLLLQEEQKRGEDKNRRGSGSKERRKRRSGEGKGGFRNLLFFYIFYTNHQHHHRHHHHHK